MRLATVILAAFAGLAFGSLSYADEPSPATGFELEETAQFDEETRTDWPGDWVTARAYMFNMAAGHGSKSTLFAWRDGEWHPNLEAERELDRSMGEAAAELVHRAQGELLMSKCPFPRHAVVFFDAEGEPLGSVNVCFECTDILVWPPYFGEGEAAERAEEAKFAAPPSDTSDDAAFYSRMGEVNAAVLAEWGRFFGHLDWPLEPERPSKKSRSKKKKEKSGTKKKR